MKMLRVAAPVLVFFIALLVWAERSNGATFIGSGAEWARSIKAHAPGPAGPEITVNFGACPGLPDAGGCWAPWRSELWIFGRNETMFMHELGHAVDSRNLDDYERSVLMEILGYPAGTSWDPPGRRHDLYCVRVACPLERFADVYAGCALLHPLLVFDRSRVITGRVARRGEVTSPWWGARRWRVTRSQYAHACRTIRSFALTPAAA